MRLLRMKQIKWLAAAVLITAAAAGCGYRLQGAGDLYDGVSRVSVSVFENKTTEAGAGVSFANALIREIQERTRTRVVQPGAAARNISGVIQAITFGTQSRSDTHTVVERQVTAVMDVKLVNAAGEVLWSVKGFSASESYTVASDKVDDEANKARAVDEIALRAAERLVNQMSSRF